jgi:hypothetical protein
MIGNLTGKAMEMVAVIGMNILVANVGGENLVHQVMVELDHQI